MTCCRCGAEIPDISVYCNICGRKQYTERRVKARGNGQGSVFKKPNGKYMAQVTVGYYTDNKGIRRRRTRSATFDRKKDALAAIPTLLNQPEKKRSAITFHELYEKWQDDYADKVGKSTMDCYRAGYKHFKPVWFERIDDIDIDDLQECVDNCGHGRRTKENMKALAGLMYKYGIPRHMVPENLNLAQFINARGEQAAHRDAFDDDQLEKIRKSIGEAPYIDYIYCLIYLGFRPSEFLSLTVDSYDPVRRAFVGGAKTEAGINRVVPVSPKIQPYIDAILADRREGSVFCDSSGNAWTLKKFTEDAFYPALEAAGIDNPLVEIAGGVKRHQYTPHSCRRTFATLMKRVKAPDKDKQELIGHASPEQLQYYQDVNYDDLRRIIDML